jgi:hypothetical protein
MKEEGVLAIILLDLIFCAGHLAMFTFAMVERAIDVFNFFSMTLGIVLFFLYVLYYAVSRAE